LINRLCWKFQQLDQLPNFSNKENIKTDENVDNTKVTAPEQVLVKKRKLIDTAAQNKLLDWKLDA
jgi:hypothetical protein